MAGMVIGIGRLVVVVVRGSSLFIVMPRLAIEISCTTVNRAEYQRREPDQ